MDNGLRNSEGLSYRGVWDFFSFNWMSEERSSYDCNSGDSDGFECQDSGQTALAGPLGRDRAEKALWEMSGRAAKNRTGQPPWVENLREHRPHERSHVWSEDKNLALSSGSGMTRLGDTRYKSSGQEPTWHVQGGGKTKTHSDPEHSGGRVESEVHR